LRRHLGVLAAYAALTVLFTWPLAAQFTVAVPGGGDAWQHLWNLWWMRKTLAGLHGDPFYTTYLYYPGGVSLLFHTLVPLEGALTVPFQILGVDLVPLYNGVLLASFVLSGYATWLLVRDLSGHGGAAFVAGFAFAFCPYHLGHLLGHMNLASLQWLPFYLWALFRACGAPGARPAAPAPGRATLGWAALAGLFLVANAFTEWIYVAFLAVFTGGYVLWRALADTRGRAGWAAWPRLLGGLAVLGAVFAVLAGPLLLRTALAQTGQDWMRLPPRETLIYSSDLVDSFVPSALHPLWSAPARELERRQPQRDTAERSVFLGYTAILVAGLGVALRRDRATAFWALVAAGAWVLSLGPVLHVLGQSTLGAAQATIPLPYQALYALVPGFAVMRVPARFIVLASLALAVLIGYALAALGQRRPGSRRSGLIAAAVGALLAIEFLAVPYPLAGVGYKIPFYAAVAREPGNFALLELPLRPMSDYLAYQTVHGKPLVHGYLSRQPPDPFVAGTPVLHYLLNSTPVGALAPADAAAGVAALRAANVRYAIVHWWAFTDAEAATMRAKLAAVFPGQTPRDDPAHRMAIYTIGP